MGYQKSFAMRTYQEFKFSSRFSFCSKSLTFKRKLNIFPKEWKTHLERVLTTRYTFQFEHLLIG